MSLSAPFIRRPVATILLTFGVAASGALAFSQLPVSPLPQVDFPTISVRAQLPGASPEVVATSVATPLERHLGQIADVTEMTSSSTVGYTRINLQFGLNRDINGAARDVQAAINAAFADLPTDLRSNPTYRKVNPADAPILILALTSDTITRGGLYDAASTVLSQKLSQVDGVGEVVVSGSALPAVRVELNSDALYKYGIGLEDLRAALASANSHSPKGAIEVGDRHYQLYDNDQASTAAEYQPLIVAYRNGAAVRLTDVADVVDSVEDLRNAGLANGKPSVLVIIYRQPGANIVATVDRVIGLLPELHASISPAIDIMPAVDRSTTIRASLAEIERTLMLAVVLVVLVVRSGRATLVPTVAVPVSLIGTLGVMYLLGYSLDNLSLMALTVATGFVVDDAIVVLENISRHIEQGMSRMQAALQGAAEVSFTVLSMSVSLIAVFIPILLMGGIVGRLFREFAVTLSAAIMLSLVVSLATTPMMCALILRRPEREGSGRLMRWSERFFTGLQHAYDRSLTWALDHSAIVLAILVGTLCLNIYLYVIVPKGFFPQQDTGRIIGAIQADQAISFQLMQQKLQEFIAIIRKDPAVQTVVGFTGGGTAGGQTNGGFIFMSLKPSSERQISADRVITQLRREVAQVPGASLFLQAVQDIRIGGRSGNAQYQYTLQDYDADELFAWSPRILAELQSIPQITQVNTDQQNKGLETDITINRDTAARLGIDVAQIDNTLYDAFGQRQVSTVYNARNQYHVVMEAAPQYWQNAETLKDVFISTAGGTASGTQTTNAVAGTVVRPGGGRGSDLHHGCRLDRKLNAERHAGHSDDAIVVVSCGHLVGAAGAFHDRRHHDIAHGDHICNAASAPDLVRTFVDLLVDDRHGIFHRTIEHTAGVGAVFAGALAADHHMRGGIGINLFRRSGRNRRRCSAQPGAQFHRQYRSRHGLNRIGCEHQRRNDDSAERRHPFRLRQCPARCQPPGTDGREHNLFQSRAGRRAQRCRPGDQCGDGPTWRPRLFTARSREPRGLNATTGSDERRPMVRVAQRCS
jgi:multidrug efflux pump